MHTFSVAAAADLTFECELWPILFLVQDGYERSPPATPPEGSSTGDADVPAASLTPASFARVRSDVFHTPAGSRFQSMEFLRVDEEKPSAAEDIAGMQQQRHGDGDSAVDLSTIGHGPFSKPPNANVAASDVTRNAGDAAASGVSDTGRHTAGEESTGASSFAATSPMDSGEARAAEENGTLQPPASRQAAADSSSSSPAPAAAVPAGSDSQPSANASRSASNAGEQAQPDAASRHAPAGTALDASPPSNADGDPLHPWSLARPAQLAVPNPADAAPATISLADASAPVGEHCTNMAIKAHYAESRA
jgi:hypothetical protein